MESDTMTMGALLRSTRDTKRRERLHRQIGALEAKRTYLIFHKPSKWNDRVWRLTSKIKRLESELRQPVLFM